MSEVAYEDAFVDDEIEEPDGNDGISDLEFRDMVKRSHVDLLLCVFNLWKTTQVVHEDFKEVMTKIGEVEQLAAKIERANQLLARIAQPKADKKDGLFKKGMMIGIVALQLITLLAVFLR